MDKRKLQKKTLKSIQVMNQNKSVINTNFSRFKMMGKHFEKESNYFLPVKVLFWTQTMLQLICFS